MYNKHFLCFIIHRGYCRGDGVSSSHLGEFHIKSSVYYHSRKSSNTSCADLQLLGPGGRARLHLVKPLDELNELGAALILKLVLVGKNSLEDGQKTRGEFADGSILPLVQLADHAVQGVVLLVVVLEGKDVHQDGQNVLGGDSLTVAEDHAGDTASGVVLQAGNVHLEALLKTAEDGGVGLGHLVSSLGVLNQATNSVGSVGAGLGVLVTETVQQQLEEGGGQGSDGSTHSVDALSKNTDSGSTLKGLAGAGVAEDGLLEHLPQLNKAGAKGSSHAGDDVEGSVNDDPVELGGLIRTISFLLILELHLARVLLADDVGDLVDNVGENALISNEGGTAEAQVLGHVAVNVRDGSTKMDMLANARQISSNKIAMRVYVGVIRDKRGSHHACSLARQSELG